MMQKLSFHKVWGGLEKALGIAQQRHALITENISHLETPRYKPKEIDFQSALQQAVNGALRPGVSMAQTNPRHLGGAAQGLEAVEVTREEGEWNGSNWVNMDREMTRLAENDLLFRTASEILIRKIGLLKEIIREGGR